LLPFSIDTLEPLGVTARLKARRAERRRDLPTLVKLGGWGLMVVHAAIGIASFAIVGIFFVLELIWPSANQSRLFIPFLMLCLQVALHFVLFRLGDALTRGQRAAVYGLVIWGTLAAICGVLMLISGAWLVGLLVLSYVAGLCAAPSVAAFYEWRKFV
jgi:hypothetical protein